MRHLKRTAKLGRTGQHRNAMLANMVCSLILHKRITTTLAKAKAARPVAEKLLTLGKVGTLHARRIVESRLREKEATRILFNEIAPTQKERRGGYTRIIQLERRPGDAAQKAILEFVDAALMVPIAPVPAAPGTEVSKSADAQAPEAAKPAEAKVETKAEDKK